MDKTPLLNDYVIVDHRQLNDYNRRAKDAAEHGRRVHEAFADFIKNGGNPNTFVLATQIAKTTFKAKPDSTLIEDVDFEEVP